MASDTTVFDSLYQSFYVAAYGCNHRCENAIREVFRRHRCHIPFLFFEYFLTQPLPRKLPATWGADWKKSVFVVAPFAARIAENAVAVPNIQGGRVTSTFRSPDVLHRLRLVYRFDHSKLTELSWEHWSGFNKSHQRELRANSPPKGPKVPNTFLSWPALKDVTQDGKQCVGFVDGWTLQWQRGHASATKDERISYLSLRALSMLWEAPFGHAPLENVPAIFVPIASPNLFYGGIWVMFPGLGITQKSKPQHIAQLRALRTDTGCRVMEVVDKVYLPALAVLHEHWLECRHKDYLKINPDPADPSTSFTNISLYDKDAVGALSDIKRPRMTYANPFLLIRQGQDRAFASIGSDIETQFRDLWSRRLRGNVWGVS